MDLGAAGLLQQPFPTHGNPLAVVSYGSEQAALEVLRGTCENPHGVSLLQGPTLSGKSTLLQTFLGSLTPECAVAVVDGKGLSTADLSASMLHQYGYDVEASSANEVLGLVRVFALQQTVSHKAPMLIIENADELNASALCTLCELAALRVRNDSALKIVLVSEQSLQPITSAPAMEPVAKRLLHDFHLQPMTQIEAKNYLHTKLRAAGSEIPEFVFPDEVCQELHKASGGWPGILDRVALLALARAKSLPVAAEEVERPALPAATGHESTPIVTDTEPVRPAQPPRLIVTNNGSVMQELTVEKTRMLVGRSEHNDISIDSRFISRHHAMLVRHGSATFLMDLNSTNGTYVNSTRVSNHVLIHEDVVTIGHHRIKFHDPYATSRGKLDGVEFADTAIMKTLDDMRKLLARENTTLLPAPKEDLPTIGG